MKKHQENFGSEPKFFYCISNNDIDWDSKNISHPVMLDIDDNLTCLFYNGNGCGETGVGTAVLNKE